MLLELQLSIKSIPGLHHVKCVTGVIHFWPLFSRPGFLALFWFSLSPRILLKENGHFWPFLTNFWPFFDDFLYPFFDPFFDHFWPIFTPFFSINSGPLGCKHVFWRNPYTSGLKMTPKTPKIMLFFMTSYIYPPLISPPGIKKRTPPLTRGLLSSAPQPTRPPPGNNHFFQHVSLWMVAVSDVWLVSSDDELERWMDICISRFYEVAFLLQRGDHRCKWVSLLWHNLPENCDGVVGDMT